METNLKVPLVLLLIMKIECLYLHAGIMPILGRRAPNVIFDPELPLKMVIFSFLKHANFSVAMATVFEEMYVIMPCHGTCLGVIGQTAPEESSNQYCLPSNTE